jgi:hypothetical protein
VLGIDTHAEPIPGYRLLERLGQGGFGEVWKAEAPGGFLKAVKIVHGNLEGPAEDVACARQEFKALQRVKAVRHPFLLSLERCDLVNGRLIIVMELADRNLHDRFRECRAQGLPGIPRPELLRYLAETAEALDLMNREHQLQHLDIKPQNLFLLHNHIKIGDFGLVKDLEGMRAQATPGVSALYAAPETFEGSVSRFSDQYNLAIVYQELLTGQLPFTGKNARQLLMQHLTGEPDLSPLPPGDREPIRRALAKRPEDRHPTCAALVEALCRAGDLTPALLPNTPATRTISLANTSPEPIRDDPAAGEPAAALAPERPERTGDGVLCPALVIGLGGLGAEVLREFRKALHKRWGPPAVLPHLRLLQIDADPDALAKATRGETEAALAEKETVLARLQRPAHYLKPGRERQAVEAWFPLGFLSRFARDQVTPAGSRLLGRLAFAGCAAGFLTRLRAELEACTDTEALATAERKTGLTLRTTRPRVYVVAGLGGGTGSGMFLDVAYAARHVLRQLGYGSAEVVGLLLLPQARGSDLPPPAALANTCAALTELNHFASGQEHFAAAYPDVGETISSQDPPFHRCLLLPLPPAGTSPRELAGRAGDFLYRDLTTPVGRAADGARATRVPPARRMPLQTFGAYWFAVPHRLLLQRVAHRLCRRLVLHWRGQDEDALAKGIKDFIAGELGRRQLSPELLAGRLEQACARHRGQAAGEAFDNVLRQRAGEGPAALRGRAATVTHILADLDALLVGGPADDKQVSGPGQSLGKTLEQAARDLEAELESQLAELALKILTEPQFRLTGAEEAARREITALLPAEANTQQALAARQAEEAEAVRQQILALQQSLGGWLRWWGQKARTADELMALLASYPRLRYQGLLAGQVGGLYQNLAAKLLQYARDLRCCHGPIRQFLRCLDGSAASQAEVDLGLGRYLLPAGCRTLTEATDRILAGLAPEELQEIHDKVQNLIGTRFQAQLHLCTAPPSFFKDLEEAVFQQIAVFAETQLCKAHAATLYLENHTEDAGTLADLAGAFAEAAPDLGAAVPAGGGEVCILGVPAGPEGDYFRSLVRQALPGQDLVPVANTDDIVFYREQPDLPLGALPQLGPAAQEAYRMVIAEDKITPHSRTDVTWRPLPS